MSTKKQQEHWMQSKWRPAMGWVYMVTCTCDFILFPVGWSVLQSVIGANVTQWNPITLQGAGLYHLAMGAVLGVAAWSRGQEKMTGTAGPGGGGFGGAPSSFGNNTGAGFGGGFGGGAAPAPGYRSAGPGGFNSATAQGYNTHNNAGYSPAPLPAPDVRPGVRLSDNAAARVVLPDDPNDDADARIK